MASDFLKNLSGLIEKPEIQSALKMLGGQQPTAGVSENLTVPFGLTFDQGQRLRESAAGLDESRARANAEAQRVAIESREAETRQKATEHAIKNADLTDAEKQLNEHDDRVAEIWETADAEAAVENLRSKNDVVVNRQSARDEIALKQMDYNLENDPGGIGYAEARSRMAVDQAQILSYEAAAAASRNEILRSEMKAAGIPDVEMQAELYQNWLAGEERIKSRLTTTDASGWEIAPDPDQLNKALTAYWIDGYMKQAVSAHDLGKWLPADEYAEVLRLEQVRARGNPQELAAEQDKFKRDWEDNFSLDRSIPDDNPMSQPIDLEVNETAMESRGLESAGRNRTSGEESPNREGKANGGETASAADRRKRLAEEERLQRQQTSKGIAAFYPSQGISKPPQAPVNDPNSGLRNVRSSRRPIIEP